MPVAFSQVREDALVDESVVLGLGEKVDVLMIASGGCTAALLASMPQVRRLHLVDPNSAQLALSRLKLHCSNTRVPRTGWPCLTSAHAGR